MTFGEAMKLVVDGNKVTRKFCEKSYVYLENGSLYVYNTKDKSAHPFVPNLVDLRGEWFKYSKSKEDGLPQEFYLITDSAGNIYSNPRFYLEFVATHLLIGDDDHIIKVKVIEELEGKHHETKGVEDE